MTARLFVLGLAAAAVPLAAGHAQPPAFATAPPGTPDTLYCMRVEALTGSRIEHVTCWTRADWAEQGVDVDRDWAMEGVRTIG